MKSFFMGLLIGLVWRRQDEDSGSLMRDITTIDMEVCV